MSHLPIQLAAAGDSRRGDRIGYGLQVPVLTEDCVPPAVLGPAALCTAMMRGATVPELATLIDAHGGEGAGRLYDLAIALQLAQRRAAAMELQCAALARSSLFRIHQARSGAPAMRLLAVMAAGDLMANMPVDFIIDAGDVRLDLLVLSAGQKLPDAVPDHDVLIFAAAEPDLRMAALHALWPRPVLNDPALLPRLARDRLPVLLAGIPGLHCPPCVTAARRQLEAPGHLLPDGRFPVLIRPHGSHGGGGLVKLDRAEELSRYLAQSAAAAFHLTAFIDYADADGMFRKYRVAMIDGQPLLCHMAISPDWMVHYVNAGMYQSATRQAEEARAMAEFHTGFAVRHRQALATLHARLGFDYYSIDCAELADGRLLVFEADTAALVHVMESPDRFAYKHAQMQLVIDGFLAMLRRRAAGVA